METANSVAMTFENSGGHAENGDEDQVKKWLETMTLGLAGLPTGAIPPYQEVIFVGSGVRSRKHRSRGAIIANYHGFPAIIGLV